MSWNGWRGMTAREKARVAFRFVLTIGIVMAVVVFSAVLQLAALSVFWLAWRQRSGVGEAN